MSERERILAQMAILTAKINRAKQAEQKKAQIAPKTYPNHHSKSSSTATSSSSSSSVRPLNVNAKVFKPAAKTGGAHHVSYNNPPAPHSKYSQRPPYQKHSSQLRPPPSSSFPTQSYPPRTVTAQTHRNRSSNLQPSPLPITTPKPVSQLTSQSSSQTHLTPASGSSSLSSSASQLKTHVPANSSNNEAVYPSPATAGGVGQFGLDYSQVNVDPKPIGRPSVSLSIYNMYGNVYVYNM